MKPHDYSLPEFSLRFIPVWRRHYLVWRKLAVPSILANLADPLIMLFGLGYGLGAMLGDMGGTSYFAFLAAGFVASSSMYAATFEGLYSAFSRMHVQKTWDAIVNAPMTLEDVLTGEWVWAATKALAAGLCVLAVVAAFGHARSWLALWAIPAVLLLGLVFAALALAVTSFAKGYDFFSYYMTLVLTPMLMLCGVFFPVERLPDAVRAVSSVLPLYHGVALLRPLLSGEVPPQLTLHVAVLVAYAVLGFYAAVVLTRRRLLG